MAAKLELDDYMAQLGRAVRQTRKAAGLSQLVLAELAGVGKSAVFDIEKGKVNVQFDTLLKVLHVLHIELSYRAPVEITS